MRLRWLACVLYLLPVVPLEAEAGIFGGRKPTEVIEDEVEEKKSERELRTQERLAALDAAQSEKNARVVVLKWPGTDTDHHSETLIRNIKNRIARPEAKFYPEIDLYQAGRKEPDPAVRPYDQRAIVPDSAIQIVMDAVEEIAPVPWNALDEQDWGLKAHELREVAKEIWFIDRPELRRPMFLLYEQIGRAAESSNNGAPPFYEYIGDKPVNYYWYLAGTLANEDPGLMAELTDPDTHASIGFYKDSLDQGLFPPMTLSFELEADYNPKAFATEYEVYINGQSQTITDAQGLYRSNPGRVDVYMSRDDGHSLSERIELDKLSEKFYFVQDVARKKMGVEFINQLMEHPYECTPEVDGEILNYLAIYARLHPRADVYVVVPRGGSIASRNLFLWRWDRPSGTLQKVLDDTGGFPVRFALLVGAGLTFNSGTYQAPTSNELADKLAEQTDPTDPSAGANAALDAAQELPVLSPSGLPIFYHLRGHYNRLMVTTGMEFAANLVADADWTDKYQTNENRGPKYKLTSTKTVQVDQKVVEDDAGNQVCNITGAAPLGGTNTGTGGELSCPKADVDVSSPVLRERKWQRLVFLGVGVVFGRNAAVGFGPRLYVRTGWYNNPHAADLTGHVGLAARPPFTTKASGRVRPLIDFDFFGGILIPYRDSIYIEGNRKLGKVMPTFGATLSAGLTF